MKRITPKRWKELKNQEISRKEFYYLLLSQFREDFNNTCQACRKRFTIKSRRLSLHHIIPRDQGGTDETGNLILLCRNCHDAIEADWGNFRTYDSIAYSFSSKKKKDNLKTLYEQEMEIQEALDKSPKRVVGVYRITMGKIIAPAGDTDWYRWVYGGQKNPLGDIR